jgi:hypothetical protein
MTLRFLVRRLGIVVFPMRSRSAPCTAIKSTTVAEPSIRWEELAAGAKDNEQYPCIQSG